MSKYTPWMSALRHTPVRTGTYEFALYGDRRVMLDWDGKRWLFKGEPLTILLASDKWRGLTREEYVKRGGE